MSLKGGRRMKIVKYGRHTIEVHDMSLTGKETVRYDGKVASEKRSVSGTTHIFSVNEEGQEVTYEVEIGVRWHWLSAYCVIRRNGVVIYSDR